MNKSAFTLTELMIIVVVLIVLASLAFPRYTTIMEKSRCAEALILMGNLREAQMAYKLRHGTYAARAFANAVPDFDYDPPPLKFFDPALTTVYNCELGYPHCVLVEVYRNDSSYHLHIQEDGQIDCSESTRPADFCERMGFKDDYF